MAEDIITVFISYAHEDAKLARAIKEHLETAGFTVWIDEGALRAGDSLIESITAAIHDMEFVVASSRKPLSARDGASTRFGWR